MTISAMAFTMKAQKCPLGGEVYKCESLEDLEDLMRREDVDEDEIIMKGPTMWKSVQEFKSRVEIPPEVLTGPRY